MRLAQHYPAGVDQNRIDADLARAVVRKSSNQDLLSVGGRREIRGEGERSDPKDQV